jgi:hypothetical protein
MNSDQAARWTTEGTWFDCRQVQGLRGAKWTLTSFKELFHSINDVFTSVI